MGDLPNKVKEDMKMYLSVHVEKKIGDKLKLVNELQNWSAYFILCHLGHQVDALALIVADLDLYYVDPEAGTVQMAKKASVCQVMTETIKDSQPFLKYKIIELGEADAACVMCELLTQLITKPPKKFDRILEMIDRDC